MTRRMPRSSPTSTRKRSTPSPLMNNPFSLFAGLLKRRRTDARGDLSSMDAERLAWYGRYLRAYEGYSIRGELGTTTLRRWRRLKFNLNEPIVNLSAGFFAAQPITWQVKGNPD